MVASSKPATNRGSDAPSNFLPKMTAPGLVQVSPSVFSGAGGGVSKLTITNKTQQMQKTHHACIMKEIPRPLVMSFSRPTTGRSRMKEAAPNKKPAESVMIDASLVPRFQKTPNRK